MKNFDKDERRKTERYPGEYDLNYDFSYDVKTKLKVQKVDSEGEHHAQKHAALSQNISTEGLCFISKYKLHKGDALHLELFLPGASKAIDMEGEVRWAKSVLDDKRQKQAYNVGVKLFSVDGQSVHESVCIDSTYHVAWSIVLERVFNTYKNILNGRKDKNTPLDHF